MTYSPTLRGGLSFGDVCEAEFLYDVHVRSDARAMGTDVMKASFAKRYGLNEDLPYFIPGANIKQQDDWVLAHGSHAHAVVLADDCLILTVLGRDDEGPKKNRRLLFAPTVDADENQVAELEEANFGRFPLRADDTYDQHRMIDLRRCFMADVGDVHDALEAGPFIVRSLDDETRADLAVRWSAYALRRGPFVAEDSLEKFVKFLLDGDAFDERSAIEAANRLADVVATAWRFEGAGVEVAGNAGVDKADPKEVIARLVLELEQMHAVVGAALETVSSL